MNVKSAFMLSLLVALTVAGINPAHAAPPPCVDADIADLPFSAVDFEVSAESKGTSAVKVKQRPRVKALFSLPVLQQPYDSLRSYGFRLALVVGGNGQVDCASATPLFEKNSLDMNTVRTQFMERITTWRFKPYVVGGKAMPVIVNFAIREEELPKSSVAAPVGDPDLLTITLDYRPRYLSIEPYFHVELHADGSAVYIPNGDDDVLGPQTYLVDPTAVKSLIAEAQAADFWSLRDQYRGSLEPSSDMLSFGRMSITLGGKTKSLITDLSYDSPIPGKVNDLYQAILRAANIEFWLNPTLATLDQLKANGFDFQSKRAGILLLQMVENSDVKDEVILAVIRSGAPQDERNYEEGLLEVSLKAGRTGVSALAIGGGALLTEGKIDQKKVNKAFFAAVHSAKLPAVEQILPFHPDMTYPDANDPTVNLSIILALRFVYIDDEDLRAVAQQLIDLGADVNARDTYGQTLLHRLSHQPDFARFLVERGADVNATDQKGNTPLGKAYDQDVVLVLLEHGANPRLGETGKQLRFNIKRRHWTEVKTWLKGHGYSDVLIAQQGDR